LNELDVEHPSIKFAVQRSGDKDKAKQLILNLYPLSGFFSRPNGVLSGEHNLKEQCEFGSIKFHSRRSLQRSDNTSFASRFKFDENREIIDFTAKLPLHEAGDSKAFENALIFDLNDEKMLFGDSDFFDTSVSHAKGPPTKRYDVSCDDTAIYQEEYYEGFVGRAGVHHAYFARDILPPAFQSSLSNEELLQFHRPLSTFISANLPLLIRIPSQTRSTKVEELLAKGKKHIPKKEKELSARDGSLIMLEYIEERPPVLINLGMASELLVYYRKANSDDKYVPDVSP
jgi:hypothetical protein